MADFRRGAATKSTWQFAFLLVLIPAVALQVWRHTSPSTGDEAKAEPAWSALVRSMDQMHTTMAAVERSGASDIDFARLMLPHHQAAIDMARTELIYGKDPQMRRLAQEIITDQQSEIELMQLWLRRHEPVLSKAKKAPASHK